MDYEIKNSLEILLNDLDKSLNSGFLFSALSLGLIIPDLCAKAKYPEMNSTGERYKKRFNVFVVNQDEQNDNINVINKNTHMPYLSGELVYKLRCAFLHNGSSNIEGTNFKEFNLDNFILRVENKNERDIYADSASIIENSHKTEYIINIRRFCLMIKYAAETFLRKESEEVINRIDKIKIEDIDLNYGKIIQQKANFQKYKIISWNSNGKFRIKFKEITDFDADIYIIQECEDPKQTKSKEYKEWASNYIWLGEDKNKGLGVFARKDIDLKELERESYCLKYFLPLRINDSFNLLAVWTQNPYIEEYYIYQYINKHHYDEKTVLFGDFNSNKRFENKYITRKERGHIPTVKELSGLGFVDAYHYLNNEEQGEETKNTFYLWRHLDRGFHIDHCFLNPKILKSYKVLDDEKWLKFSDHMPCILEINID